jgi:hypothetical protein
LLGLDLSRFGIDGQLEGTDEAIIAGALMMSPQAVVSTELAITIPLLALIALRIPARHRLIVLSVLTIGVLVGWVGWLTFGSKVLP